MTDKTIFFITLALVCVWLILDNFYGNKRIDNFVASLFPSLSKEKDSKGWWIW